MSDVKVGDRQAVLVGDVRDTPNVTFFDKEYVDYVHTDVIAMVGTDIPPFPGPWDYVPEGSVKTGELVVLELKTISTDTTNYGTPVKRRFWKVVE